MGTVDNFMPRIFCVAVALLVTIAVCASPASLSVTVVGAERTDPRWQAADEAVSFWNEELEKDGANVRLGPAPNQPPYGLYTSDMLPNQ